MWLFLRNRPLLTSNGSIVRSYSFGNDNGLLLDLSKASVFRTNLARLLLGVQFSRHFGWVLALPKLLPPSIGKAFVPPGIKDLLQFKMVSGDMVISTWSIY